MNSDSWYHKLTGPVPSLAPMLPLSHALSVFGEWNNERIQADLIAPLQVRNEALLSRHHRSQCKALPEGEPVAQIFHIPTHECGCTLVMAAGDDGGRQVVAIGPTSEAGSQHRFSITRAHLFPDRVTAILEGDLIIPDGTGEPMLFPIAFHDRNFALCRGYYEVGRISDFCLAGFALTVAIAAAPANAVPNINELSVLFPLSTVCLAHRHFRGKILSVKPMIGFGPTGEIRGGFPAMDNMELIHGQNVWRVETLVGQAPDISVDLIITDRATPAALDILTEGNWIEGIAMMTGHCLFI